MKYLFLAADYMEPSVRDIDPHGQLDGFFFYDLSDELQAEIKTWNDDYQFVVPLELPERASIRRQIDELDARGLALAERVSEELSPSKIRYYSEGLLRYLS